MSLVFLKNCSYRKRVLPFWRYSVFVCQSKLEMATAQRTRPRAVVGAPRRAAWQLKSALRLSVSVARVQ